MRDLQAGERVSVPANMREKSCRRRTRGRSYAVVIQQLSGEVDNLHEALRQLQLENRDLKLRQEVLEQWCRINRLALQAMRTCGGVLLGGQQQDLPQAAIAAIEDAEEWIQKQLVDYDPVPADDAAELPPPKASSSGSSASCTLQGQALSLMEYALRYLLAHPQRYAHVSGMIEPDVALEVVQGLRGEWMGAAAVLHRSAKGGHHTGPATVADLALHWLLPFCTCTWHQRFMGSAPHPDRA
jgi:hypothetical protein